MPYRKKGEDGLVTYTLCALPSSWHDLETWRCLLATIENHPFEVPVKFTLEGYVWSVKRMSIIFFFSN